MPEAALSPLRGSPLVSGRSEAGSSIWVRVSASPFMRGLYCVLSSDGVLDSDFVFIYNPFLSTYISSV